MAARLREEVHHPSEYAHDGENHQAHDEQVFQHPLTAFVVETVNHNPESYSQESSINMDKVEREERWQNRIWSFR
jgi:hypothetical protein